MKTRVLIINGSTPATIQALTILDPKKYEVDVCDSNQFCWARFHNHCSKFFVSPNLNTDLNKFLEFLSRRLKTEKYDAILPVHEEGLFLSAHMPEFKKYTNILLGNSKTFLLLMNKKLTLEKARSIGITIPKEGKNFPYYLKLPYGTSSNGVFRITSKKDLTDIKNRFAHEKEIISQQEVVGQQLTIQTIFVGGKLISSHQYLALSTGFGGGASRRISQNDSDILDLAKKFGTSLNLTGPMMLDFIRDSNTGIPYLIETNPRLGETYNAYLSGLNFPELMIKLSLGEKVKTKPSQEGVKSHQMFTEVTGAVKRDLGLVSEYQTAFKATFNLRSYKCSTDEFIHPTLDPVSVLITILIFFLLPLLNKRLLTKFNRKAANLSPIEAIRYE